VSSTECGVVKEIVIDASFVDGFRACAKDGLCVVGNEGVVCAGVGGYGERGAVYFFVCFVVEDDAGGIVFSTFAIAGDGKEEGIKCFFKAD